mmetsp:Transcript_15809/g.22016  ORF Transcript_15809/g.22016 Transcript_15809/m.22016 type:complete len:161 (-) Transcript_15809:66-548(-)
MAAALKVNQIILFVLCIILLCLSGWYWYYLSIAVPNKDWTAVVIYFISGGLVVFMSILGAIGAWKKYSALLLYFAVVMVIMLILGILQIILVAVAQKDCGKKNNAFDFVCDIGGGSKEDLLWFWLPTCALLLTNLLCFFFALAVRKLTKNEEGGTANNYY